MTTTTHADFRAPGPGTWELEATHATHPVSRWLGSILPAATERGFREGMKRYGVLLEGFDVRIVEGFIYMAPRIVGAPKGATGTPPKFVFKLLNLLHPEIRRRNRRAEEVFATKAWREDVRRWDEELHPACQKANGALAAVEPASLDDAALLEHVTACTKQLELALELHHTFNACIVLPVGDFLVHAQEWTQRPLDQLMPLLRGSSPISGGFPKEIEALKSEIDPNDPDLVTTLRRCPKAAAWFAVIDHRTVSGHDLSGITTTESPALLRRVLLASLSSAEPKPAVDPAEIRDEVPEPYRQQFDELFAEARLVYRLRDERSYHNDMWSMGLMRRALLEAGRRLVARGHLDDAEHAIDLEPSELPALLREGRGPSAKEIAGRVRRRTSRTTADAPMVIGPPPSPPPPLDYFTPAQARSTRAVQLYIREMFSVAAQREPATPEPIAKKEASSTPAIRGLAASHGTYEGRARIVLGPETFASIEQGDVLVTRTTSPTYNVLLPMIGGIVTDRGGLLSHAAIVAREYGIPAVVGTSDATKRIKDRDRVRIDGALGTVEVLG